MGCLVGVTAPQTALAPTITRAKIKLIRAGASPASSVCPTNRAALATMQRQAKLGLVHRPTPSALAVALRPVTPRKASSVARRPRPAQKFAMGSTTTAMAPLTKSQTTLGHSPKRAATATPPVSASRPALTAPSQTARPPRRKVKPAMASMTTVTAKSMKVCSALQTHAAPAATCALERATTTRLCDPA